MKQDRCVKCRKQMHRMGANTCYPCNFKDGIKKGQADLIKRLKSARKASHGYNGLDYRLEKIIKASESASGRGEPISEMPSVRKNSIPNAPENACKHGNRNIGGRCDCKCLVIKKVRK